MPTLRAGTAAEGGIRLVASLPTTVTSAMRRRHKLFVSHHALLGRAIDRRPLLASSF